MTASGGPIDVEVNVDISRANAAIELQLRASSSYHDKDTYCI